MRRGETSLGSIIRKHWIKKYDTARLAVFLIRCPTQGIVLDVLFEDGVFGVVPDDVVVEIALPDGGAGGAAQGVDARGHRGFETAN